MSNYTTGELAKLCGVTVRTVQYYDTRGILVPTMLSEGGRRLYTQQDLHRLQIICFLRELGLPLNSIGQLFAEANPANVIRVLLEEQTRQLTEEQAACKRKLAQLAEVQQALRDMESVSVESIGDIAYKMQNKAKLKKVRIILLATAVPMGIMEWTSIFLWILQGIWWPFALYTLLAVPYTVWLVHYYWRHVSYICPQCHGVFKPRKMEFLFARHTMETRRLTCTCCGHKGFCVETSDARPPQENH